MAQWTLRPATAEDVPAMYALDVLCFDEPFRFDLRAMRSFAAARGAVAIAAEADGQLAGFVIVHVARGSGYVVTLDVRPDQRRLGLAQSLIEEAEARAQVNVLRLHVFAGNTPAIAFYERLGFRQVGIEAGFYGDGLDAWRYERRR